MPRLGPGAFVDRLRASLDRTRLDRAALALVLAGLALYALYASYTGPGERNPDAGAHLWYARWIAEHGALPAKTACTVCHHPPAYYVVAGAVVRALTRVGAADPALGVQILSVVLFATFVVCAALTLQRLLPTRRGRLLATALVIFWPSSVLNAPRVSNDVMVYAIGGGVLLALAHWEPARGRAPSWAVPVLLIVGACTKANAISFAAIYAIVIAVAVARAEEPRALARAVAPQIAVLLAALAVFALTGRANDQLPALLGTSGRVDAALLSPRTIRYYLAFDPRDPLTGSPYASFGPGGLGEPSYWNHLLKSSLFGTERTLFAAAIPRPESGALARVLSVLALPLIGLLAAGQLLAVRAMTAERRLMLVAAAVPIAMGLGFHLLVPYGFHADFRFVYPAVVPLAALYADSLERFAERARWLGAGAAALASVFVLTSVAYFLPATWSPRPSRKPATWQPLVAPTSSTAAPDASGSPASSVSPPGRTRIFR